MYNNFTILDNMNFVSLYAFECSDLVVTDMVNMRNVFSNKVIDLTHCLIHKCLFRFQGRMVSGIQHSGPFHQFNTLW
jgi:hypothetical protein